MTERQGVCPPEADGRQGGSEHDQAMTPAAIRALLETNPAPDWPSGLPNPFRILGPAVISVSGGRTSAYMLRLIIDAHGGTLPPDVVPIFANTGREMPATLDFVQRLSIEWSVPITWLEFRARRADGYAVVSHNSASRDGEPLEALFATQRSLPNPVQRSCTTEAKIRTIKRYVMAELGWKHWSNVIGIRADEPKRIENKKKPSRDRWTVLMPLVDARVNKSNVMDWWSNQPFDLELAGPWEGNCDGCFLKSRASIMRMQRDHPERMEWWPQQEAIPRGKSDGTNRRFRNDREPYAKLAEIVRQTPMLPMDETMHELGNGCSMWCGT